MSVVSTQRLVNDLPSFDKHASIAKPASARPMRSPRDVAANMQKKGRSIESINKDLASILDRLTRVEAIVSAESGSDMPVRERSPVAM